MSGQFYSRRQERRQDRAQGRAAAVRAGQALEEHAKGMVVPATLFEKFGFNYIGPIDGHDLDSLIPTLENIRQLKGPAVPARGHQKRARATSWPRPTRWPTTAPASSTRPWACKSPHAPKPTFTQVFGQWLCDMAAQTNAAGGHHPRHARGLGHGRV
jgi:1-deoxy-D-xylulose-5-phosphate synthase